MKTIKNLMLGIGIAGSLAFGNLKGYGQNNFKEIPELTVIAQSVNHQEFQIETYREFMSGEIVLNKYFDTNRDGKIDSLSVFSYSPEHNNVFKDYTTDSLSCTEALFPNWVKLYFPLGETFLDCKEGHFKENIYDYIAK